jgi:CarD family transcriptional regulator
VSQTAPGSTARTTQSRSSGRSFGADDREGVGVSVARDQSGGETVNAPEVAVDPKRKGAAAPGANKAGGSGPTGAAAVGRQGVAKAPVAPTPARMNEQYEKGGEQKTMKNTGNRNDFKLNEFVVYPAHGVGQIVGVEEQEVAGFKLELFVINFTKDKMTLRVPTSKVTGVGMRKLSEPDAARRSLDILTGRARVKRTMWSRRAQEYEAKINSGDINAIAEVVRDLYRSDAQPEQSYSERQLYEAALDRMMREIAAVQKLSEPEAMKVIEAQLTKNQKRAVKANAGEGEDPDVEEAA